MYQGMAADVATYLQHQGGKQHLYRLYQAYDSVGRLLDDMQRNAASSFQNSLLSHTYEYALIVFVAILIFLTDYISQDPPGDAFAI